MAIPSGSGTETIHSVLMEDVSSVAQTLITGVQHHIYTILSVTIRTVAVHASANDVNLYLVGYDSMAGTSAQSIQIASHTAVLRNTFVWNDKFSFFGYEPSSNTQVARAQQAGSTPQYLKIETAASDCKVDVTCTYIDQDWS